MKTHVLKTESQYYKLVDSGEKTFELRYNDRDYKRGDYLLLIESDLGGYGMTDHDLAFIKTGRTLKVEVTYILNGGRFGLDKEYCIMSIRKVIPPPF